MLRSFLLRRAPEAVVSRGQILNYAKSFGRSIGRERSPCEDAKSIRDHLRGRKEGKPRSPRELRPPAPRSQKRASNDCQTSDSHEGSRDALKPAHRERSQRFSRGVAEPSHDH